jgi:hypothetical protein
VKLHVHPVKPLEQQQRLRQQQQKKNHIDHQCRLHSLAAKLERALPNWEAATLVLRVHVLLAPPRTASTENSATSDAKAAERRCGARMTNLSSFLGVQASFGF